MCAVASRRHHSIRWPPAEPQRGACQGAAGVPRRRTMAGRPLAPPLRSRSPRQRRYRGGGGSFLKVFRVLSIFSLSLCLFASLPLCLSASLPPAFLPLCPSFPPSLRPPSRSNKRSPVPPPPCLEGVQILREGWESEPGWPDPCSKGDKWLWCWRVAMSAPCGFPLCIPRVT